jgi:phosphate transporter
MEKILYLYARVAAGGDLELAKQQLRAQLREKVRESCWERQLLLTSGD